MNFANRARGIYSVMVAMAVVIAQFAALTHHHRGHELTGCCHWLTGQVAEPVVIAGKSDCCCHSVRPERQTTDTGLSVETGHPPLRQPSPTDDDCGWCKILSQIQGVHGATVAVMTSEVAIGTDLPDFQTASIDILPAFYGRAPPSTIAA